MIKRSEGKWFSDKDPKKPSEKFSTLEEARAYEASLSEKPQPGKRAPGSRA